MLQLLVTVLIAAVLGQLYLGEALPPKEALRDAASRETTYLVQTGLPQLQKSYQTMAETQGGYAPLVLPAVRDGGFHARFKPALKFLPVAPQGMDWVYGKYPADGSPWASLNYICLRGLPLEQGTGAAARGILSAAGGFHPGRFFLNTHCGATSSRDVSELNTSDLSLTFFLVYTPPAAPSESEKAAAVAALFAADASAAAVKLSDEAKAASDAARQAAERAVANGDPLARSTAENVAKEAEKIARAAEQDAQAAAVTAKKAEDAAGRAAEKALREAQAKKDAAAADAKKDPSSLASDPWATWNCHKPNCR